MLSPAAPLSMNPASEERWRKVRLERGAQRERGAPCLAGAPRGAAQGARGRVLDPCTDGLSTAGPVGGERWHKWPRPSGHRQPYLNSQKLQQRNVPWPIRPPSTKRVCGAARRRQGELVRHQLKSPPMHVVCKTFKA